MDEDPQVPIRQLESLDKTPKGLYVLKSGSGEVAIGSGHLENGFVLGRSPSTDPKARYRGDAEAICSEATRLVLADNEGVGIKKTPKIGIYGRLAVDGRGFILTNLSNTDERAVHDADGGVHVIKPGSDVRIYSSGFTYDFNGKGAAEVKRKPGSNEIVVDFNTNDDVFRKARPAIPAGNKSQPVVEVQDGGVRNSGSRELQEVGNVIKSLNELDKDNHLNHILKAGETVNLRKDEWRNGISVGREPSLANKKFYTEGARDRTRNSTKISLVDKDGKSIPDFARLGIKIEPSEAGGYVIHNFSVDQTRVVWVDHVRHEIPPGGKSPKRIEKSDAKITMAVGKEHYLTVSRTPDDIIQLTQSEIKKSQKTENIQKEKPEEPIASERQPRKEPLFRKGTIIDQEDLSRIPYKELGDNKIDTPIVIGGDPYAVDDREEAHIAITDTNKLAIKELPGRMVEIRIVDMGGKRKLQIKNLTERNMVRLDDRVGVPQKVGAGKLEGGEVFSLENNKYTYFDTGGVTFTINAVDLNSIPPEVGVKVVRNKK